VSLTAKVHVILDHPSYNWPCTLINNHDWQLWNCPLFMPVVGDTMVLRVKKLKVYQCPQCPEVFYKESMLIYHHMRSHTQLTRIMPLFCHLCSYKTTLVSGIKKHMITDHLDEIGKEREWWLCLSLVEYNIIWTFSAFSLEFNAFPLICLLPKSMFLFLF